MRAVISDASPLIFLAQLGHLEWLRAIYGGIIIPDAVWKEVTSKNAPDAKVIRAAERAGWMEIKSPGKPIPCEASELDTGEREAIALAAELNALLIIDELAGRRIAKQLGLSVTGTAGVLLSAKLRGLTKSLRAELDRLEKETTFCVSRTA